jgi:hypothetical protein
MSRILYDDNENSVDFLPSNPGVRTEANNGDIWIDAFQTSHIYHHGDPNNGWTIAADWYATHSPSTPTDTLDAVAAVAGTPAVTDNKIIIIYQVSIPVVGPEGTIWVSTADNNKIYTATAGVWVETQGSRVALAIMSASLKAALSGLRHTLFYLLKIQKHDVSNTTFYCGTTHSTSVIYGGDTYYNDGKIVSVDGINLSSTVDRDTFKIVLADSDLTLVSELDSATNNSLTGATASIYAGYLDSNSQPILSAMLPVYIGTVDAYAIIFDTNSNGSATVAITLSNPMNNLDQKRSIELSKQAIRARHPADSCCDQLYEGSTAMTLRWGKRG